MAEKKPKPDPLADLRHQVESLQRQVERLTNPPQTAEDKPPLHMLLARKAAGHVNLSAEGVHTAISDDGQFAVGLNIQDGHGGEECVATVRMPASTAKVLAQGLLSAVRGYEQVHGVIGIKVPGPTAFTAEKIAALLRSAPARFDPA